MTNLKIMKELKSFTAKKFLLQFVISKNQIQSLIPVLSKITNVLDQNICLNPKEIRRFLTAAK